MQSATFTPPFPNYHNCLIRGLPINKPFRIHYDIKDRDSQIGSFVILPLQFTIQGSELLDLTGQTLSSTSKSPEESACQTKVLDTLKNYIKKQSVSNECGKVLTKGKAAALPKYSSDFTGQFNKNKPVSSQKESQANLRDNYNQDISWYDSKILPTEPTDRIQFVVLDPVSQKIGVKMISKPINLNDATSFSNSNPQEIHGTSDDTGTRRLSGDVEADRIQPEPVVSAKDDKAVGSFFVMVDKSSSISTNNTSKPSILFSDDDMEISNSDSEACDNSNITQKQHDDSLNIYPYVKIKTETDSSEYDNFTVLQKSDAENCIIKVELNENGMPLKTEDVDEVDVVNVEEQGEFGVYRLKDTCTYDQVYTGNKVYDMNSAFGISHITDQTNTLKHRYMKQRKSSKKLKDGCTINNLYVNNLYVRKKKPMSVDEDDAELKEMQKLKLVKLGADDGKTADDSCRRSSRLKSVGFRPDYLNVENKIDEFIAYVGGEIEFSDAEDEGKDVNAENISLGNEEVGKKIRTMKKPRKKKKECDDIDFDPEHEELSFRKKYKNKDKNKADRESGDLNDTSDSDNSCSDSKKADSSNINAKKAKEKKPKRERIQMKLEDHQDKFRIETLDSIARKDRGKSNLEKSVKVYVCTLCNKFKSASVEGIESHLENHMNGKLTCKECGFYASNSGQLFSHRTQMHKHLFNICPECGKELSRRHFKTHLGLAHNKPQYDCTYCLKDGQDVKKYLSLDHLHRHQKEAHKNMGYTCEKCEKLFFRKEFFEDHKKICIGRKETDSKFCERCGKKFSSCTSLRIHRNTVHLKIRTFQCPECQYSAPNRTSLRHHQLVHEGVHPFQCDQCSFTCVQAYQLKSHMRTHTGEKPYKCTQCKYAAAWNVQLKEHVKVHSMETAAMCHKCDIMFRNEKALNLHAKKEQCML
ncbi:zinc finger protein 37-like [Mercenaria mercenaria]|uniref:zinc finger protein 37-like n=1 Tax=Mercenaria mercenaria TaxID=6596 RepID=UPI00234F24CB|nr:zinc finger protein 37-like [Mercenaria mercenaria]XP_053399482.1 zinc finger protein 37-like [Mercenaria mercenaria]XP_053399485.1 zinc finger protein 37-like [Mercenaria mercenaria]XP_053399492.1 zinc finger protein 37-like [Mercenaria mercenaria]XP_053399495.1 zinc finger protein 37-like [Mercenaria mercenaria]XP_053399500.1 zinc finger protein 37-like [Mercenaria mercenaria]XP_053399511.1 zinc finger protein 37-like [Mercenaria mercenaria]